MSLWFWILTETRKLFDILGGLIFSFHNALDGHVMFPSIRPEGIVKVFKIG